jgi:hypothetical protein
MTVRLCPVCEASTRPWRITSEVEIDKCLGCGHRVAHFSSGPDDADYHEQYVEGPRLESLRITRERQARVILAVTREVGVDVDRLLDYGSGRGWFLRTCRTEGVPHLAAADTSKLAVRQAESDGFPALLLPQGEASLEAAAMLASLPFRPRLLTMLDVVEHFAPDRLEQHVRTVVAALRPELELVVIKVPVAEGLLHRVAATAAWLKFAGPVNQLYQAGTFPPHYNYFTRRSLNLLIRRLGWVVVADVGDQDFEPELLCDRVVGAGKFPEAIRRVLGNALALLVRALRMPDSRLIVARIPQP